MKYCPAPFFPSAAAFSSSPSNTAAFTSTSIAVHSVPSISWISFFRFTALVNRLCAPEKMSPSIPGSRPSIRSASTYPSSSSVPL